MYMTLLSLILEKIFQHIEPLSGIERQHSMKDADVKNDCTQVMLVYFCAGDSEKIIADILPLNV